MKIKHQLSIAALVMVGFFATGCSQQSTGDSQVAGASQQSAGGSQVAGGSQQQVEGGTQVAGGSQQQTEPKVVVTPQRAVKPKPAPVRRVVRRQPPRRVVHRRVVHRRVSHNPWLHYHPEAPKCAKTRKHSHKFKRTGARHHHRYACVKSRRMTHRRTTYQPRRRVYPPRRHVVRHVRPPQVDVRALQTKLKAKGYYRGPIDGIVGPKTRSALKRYMNR